MPGARPYDPHLRCCDCGRPEPLKAIFTGCPVCGGTKDRGALEVVYDYDWWRGQDLLGRWAGQTSLWGFRELLPLPFDAQPITLVEGGTPLIQLPSDGPGRLWLKDETRNPTGAHKDRFHAVSASMARYLGFRKVTASTTGNHGFSLAAYAARSELDCLIFCDPRAPTVLRRGIQAYGARVATMNPRREQLEWLVRERGWYPSTGMSPMPIATPFGVEGYKTIAYEIFYQFGQRMPSYVVVPVAVGDILYGPWKGFHELRQLGAAGELPKMVAVQSTGCDPIAQGFRAGAQTVPVHQDPQTIALSIGDETASANTLRTLYDSGGTAETVPDAAIIAAMKRLARSGVIAEPAAAASVAAALAMQARGAIGANEDVVCVCTGGGIKWPDHLSLTVEPHSIEDDDPASVRAWIHSFDREIC